MEALSGDAAGGGAGVGGHWLTGNTDTGRARDSHRQTQAEPEPDRETRRAA